VQKWFPVSHKGLVTGIALAGIAVSAVLYSPLTKYLADPNTGVGVANSFIIYGIVSFAVMFLLSFNMYDPPAGYDREAGGKLKAGRPAKPPKAAHRALFETEITTKDMLKTPKFYLMFFTFALSTASGLMVIANAAGIAKEQANWENGFWLAIILNIFNAAGRFLGGSISDKLGRTTTLKMALILQGANLLLFRYYTSIPLLILGIVLQGFCYGTIFSVMPTLTSDMFGLKNFGANYGTLFLAWGISGIIGPMPAAWIFDKAGEYGAAYIIACVLTAVSLALTFAIRKTKKLQPNKGQ
jgi:sugar phosphate permease